MSVLSDRQNRILEYIISVMKNQDFPPSIREIGKAVGISSTSVVNYNLAKLEELNLLTRRREVSRGLTLNWQKLVEFGFGNGQVETDEEIEENPPENSTNGYFDRGLIKVPILGHIAAGEPILINPSDPQATDRWIEIAGNVHSNPSQLFALEVQGDSMVDASVLDGDIVTLRHQETAENGEMVAAWIEGDEETTLKFLHKEGPRIRLQPANPNYEPIIRDASKVRIAGKVVSVVRHLLN